ncbi:MAG: histidinol-phosphate transaminase, partial [Planctomycetota bacterium]|nr:histidinol-phosphate transaminase [Planctomycetota bacterium]
MIPAAIPESTVSCPALCDRIATCYHGGAFFEAVGPGFDNLDRRHAIINADVLDAWFPPAPGVLATLREHLDWVLRTSPPTQCEGLIREISVARGVPEECVVPGAGSSDLLFRASLRWLRPGARVLLLDPTYGEYSHVFEHVVPCRVDRLLLRFESEFAVDLDELAGRLRQGYDLCVLVNPNNPTGSHVSRVALQQVLRDIPARTLVWIDEAYLDYVAADESLERFATESENVVVCKSMSKVYALSGVRAAYLCGPRHIIQDLRSITPPWVVGLPGQIAGVLALRDPDYYQARYAETRELRSELVGQLAGLGLHVWPAMANFLLCRLPAGVGSTASLLSHCRERGLFLRDISSMTTQPVDRVFRVAVKDCETNAAMVEILRTWLS